MLYFSDGQHRLKCVCIVIFTNYNVPNIKGLCSVVLSSAISSITRVLLYIFICMLDLFVSYDNIFLFFFINMHVLIKNRFVVYNGEVEIPACV